MCHLFFRLYEFELATSSIIEVKQPAQEEFLAKVNLPFSLEIGKFESNGSGMLLNICTSNFFQT